MFNFKEEQATILNDLNRIEQTIVGDDSDLRYEVIRVLSKKNEVIDCDIDDEWYMIMLRSRDGLVDLNLGND